MTNLSDVLPVRRVSNQQLIRRIWPRQEGEQEEWRGGEVGTGFLSANHQSQDTGGLADSPLTGTLGTIGILGTLEDWRTVP